MDFSLKVFWKKVKRMLRKWKMFLIFFFLIIHTSIVIYISSVKLSNIQDKNKTPEKVETDFKSFCEKHGEWELVDDRYFFKRSATYYFIDGYFFRFNLIKHTDMDPTTFFFHLNISIDGEKSFIQHKIESTIVQSRWKVLEYELIYIDAKFNLTSFLLESKHTNFGANLANMLSIKIEIEVKQLKREPVKSKSKLIAKIRYLKKTQSAKHKSALVCSKCLYTHADDTSAKKLEWWIEVNREAGFDNVAFCNQSISSHANFRELFEKNKNFLFLTELKCIPNLFNKTGHFDYFGKYTMLTNSYQIAVLDTLILSECYLDHFNDYKYIAIIDADEVVFTRKLSNMMDTSQNIHYIKSIDITTDKLSDSVFFQNKCNRYEPTISSSKLEDYFNEINKRSSVNYAKSFYFSQAFYIKNDMIKLIFGEIEKVLKNVQTYLVNTEELRIKVVYDDVGDFTVKNKHFILDYVFTISNEHEYDYAKNLLVLYKKVVEPYLDSNRMLFNDLVKDFDRLLKVFSIF